MAYTRPLYYTSPVMVGNDVKEVQTRLYQLGFYTSSIDGSFGPGTKTAVIKFQADAGLSQDGSCGPATWDRMFYLNYTSPQKHGSDIKKMQQRLKDLGYNPGTIDGWFGQNSKNAITEFQSKNDLSIDGSCGPTTWNALLASSALSLSKANRLLNVAGTSGLFVGSTMNFTQFSKEIPPKIVSLMPVTTVSGRVSLKARVGITGKPLSLDTTDFKNLSATAISKFTSAGIKFNFNQQLLLNTFLSINLKLGPNDALVYRIDVTPATKTVVMTIEHKRTVENVSLFTSLIITMNMTYSNLYVRVPVASTSSTASRKIVTSESLVTWIIITALIAGAIATGQVEVIPLIPAFAY